MKNLILASAIALTSIIGFSLPSQAETFRHAVRHILPHRQTCVVKVIKERIHGRMVVTKKRICR